MGEKLTDHPVTTIRLTRSQKQLLRIAAAHLGLHYQTFMRRVSLNAAWQIIHSESPDKFNLQGGRERKITIPDE